jgi:hypothetical protein
MKRALFITILLASFAFVRGQVLFNDTAFIGLSKLKLGDSLSKFGADLKKAPMSPPTYENSEGKTFYQYSPALQQPIEIANIKFHVVMCSFDADGHLVGLSLAKWPGTDHFLRKARKYYRQLTAYMTDTLHQKGKKKVYYPQVHEAYEWTKGATTIEVNIQWTDRVESTSVGIVLNRTRFMVSQ